jgi:hypothetical protein
VAPNQITMRGRPGNSGWRRRRRRSRLPERCSRGRRPTTRSHDDREIELLNQWYYNPAYLAIMQNCANAEIGVWSENSLDRTVVVAVYGQPT